MLSKILKSVLPSPTSKQKPHRYIMKEHNVWGNSIVWSDWPKMKVHGWLSRIPQKGDLLVAEFQSGKTLEFEFTNVRRAGDPQDLFFSDVKFVREVTGV